jgi:class 3 adenylate cyclase
MPKTRYATTPDGTHIAYQVLGTGPTDFVYVHAWISHVEIYWEWSAFRRFIERLGRSCRVILFDKRGMGLSDRLAAAPTFDARLDDIKAVLDEVGSERAALFGFGDGAALAAVFAATYPERTSALILWGGYDLKQAWAPDHPWGTTWEQAEEETRRMVELWGDEERAGEIAEVLQAGSKLEQDPAFGSWFAKMMRYAAGPGDVVEIDRVWWESDATHVLPAIHVPTACLIRPGWSDEDKSSVTWLTSRLAGTRVLEVPGSEFVPFAEQVEALADAITGFIGGVRAEEARLDRALATVMFTDIVASTVRATEIGDHAWSELVEGHHAVIRSLLARYRGTEVDTAGDGFFATFDGPARAVRCAQACVEAVRTLGLEIRAGLHTGEVETIAGKAGGIAVNIGSRVANLATASEVLVTQTVKDLVAGSGLSFESRGEHSLKGIPDRWRLYAATTLELG